MTTPTYATTLDQDPFSNDLLQTVQYREAWFFLFEALRLAGVATGGGIVRTCDGTAVSASNLIVDPATDVVQGTPASQAHTWAEILIGDTTWFMEVNVALTDVVPQSVRFYKASVAYNSNGTTTTKPTISVAGRESAAMSFNLLGWSVPTAGSWFSWQSAGGSVFFGVKRDGDTFYNSYVFIPRFETSAFGSCLLNNSTASTNAVTATTMLVPNPINACTPGGVFTITTHAGASPSLAMAAWTGAGGVEAEDNTVPHHPLWYGINSAGGAGLMRDLGYVTDVRAVPNSTNWDYEDTDGDAGTHKYRTVGCLALPFINGAANQITS